MISESRVNRALDQLNALQAKQDLLIETKADLVSEIQEHESFLETKDEVRDFLADLYNQSQSRTKAVYEGLLTNLVNEVMPDNTEAHSIQFSSSIKNNRTSLSIECVTRDGKARDIYRDKGGTIESIVALGLRFIALSKTKNRRIILLDEPDAWIKSGPKYIPKVAELLPQLARELGMQVVYISHHDPKYFQQSARIIELTNDGGIHADIIHDDLTPEDVERADGIGWRFIRLTNVKQHENTLFELSPYVNMLIGDGDIGKTSVIDAVDCLINNNGRESLISDGKPYCRVEIGLEGGMVLEWTYHRKAVGKIKRKTLYELKDADGKPLHTSDSSEEVPAWLHEVLAMAPYQGFDLHIGDAHKTSFILDKSVSGHKRAEVLSWGGETRQIQTMMKMHSDECKSRATSLNRCKTELNKVKSRLEFIRPIGRARQAYDEYRELTKDSSNNQETKNSLSHYIQEIERVQSRLEALSTITSVEPVDISSLIGQESDLDLKGVVDRMEFLEAGLAALKQVPNTVSLDVSLDPDKEKVLEYGRMIADLEKKIDALSSVPSVTDLSQYTSSESNDISKFGAQLAQIQNRINENLRQQEEAQHELDVIRKEKSELMIENDGRCVLCNSVIDTGSTVGDCAHG